MSFTGWSSISAVAHARPRKFSGNFVECSYVTTARTENQPQTDDVSHMSKDRYWGKKILEWSRTPQEAHATALALNNKYFLDGRDANCFANVGWIFGLHDRPWRERPIFGKVRYMNAAGLERKCDIAAYVAKVE